MRTEEQIEDEIERLKEKKNEYEISSFTTNEYTHRQWCSFQIIKINTSIEALNWVLGNGGIVV